MSVPADAVPVLAPPEPAASPLIEVAASVAKSVLAQHAERVDRDGVFPTESIDALRREKLLGAFVPRELGGLGASIAEISGICTALGRQCASTAMIFAMHQIQVACMVRHGLGEAFFQKFASENLARKQQLIASATTELGVGGDVRTSLCAVKRDGDRFTLEKNAPVISYGDDCDGILVTARRTPETASNDQVIVLLRKEDLALERTTTWNALGFRGTCSNGYLLRGGSDARQIVPGPYAEISAQTMLPVSHIVWSSLWLGIALDATERARSFIRSEAKKKPGFTPPGALRLAELAVVVQNFRAQVSDAVRDYTALMADRDALLGIGFALRMNNLKLAASELVVQIVNQAMMICGISGYRLDSKHSLSRQLRDSYGAALMVNNDRILASNAQMLLVYRET